MVLVVAGGLDHRTGLIRDPRISLSEVASRIGQCDHILSGPFTGPVSPVFQGLQDSRAKMQDSKGIFPYIALFFTSENAVFLMGEYRTVPAGDWGGGCGSGCGTDFGAKTGLIFKSAEISISDDSLDRAG